jgi:hypothetical protein
MEKVRDFYISTVDLHQIYTRTTVLIGLLALPRIARGLWHWWPCPWRIVDKRWLAALRFGVRLYSALRVLIADHRGWRHPRLMASLASLKSASRRA